MVIKAYIIQHIDATFIACLPIIRRGVFSKSFRAVGKKEIQLESFASV